MSGRRFYLNISHKISQLLNPALCLTCGITISSSEFFCSDCFQDLDKVRNPCQSCGQPNHGDGLICPPCQHKPPLWQAMVAPLVYQGITRKLIHQLKYSEQPHYAKALLTHLLPYYKNRPVQGLIPVPLHTSRLIERGFNQSLEIARILSVQLDIPLLANSLQRIKATESQSGLSLNKRRKNIAGAFNYEIKSPYHSVAIVDDVITTGSTMNEICKLLKRSGIEHIEVWSLARALKQPA